jgi:hypothetical protein
MKAGSKTHRMGARYLSSITEGKSAKDACNVVREEFKVKVADSTIRSYASVVKKQGEGTPKATTTKTSQPSTPEGKEAQRSEPAEREEHQVPAERSERKEPLTDTMPQDLENRIRAVVQESMEGVGAQMRTVAREVTEEYIQNIRNERNAIIWDEEEKDMPPEPEGKVGRKEHRRYKKVSVTLDVVLWDELEKRAKGTMSTNKLLDAILWREFGKPKLSYEVGLEPGQMKKGEDLLLKAKGEDSPDDTV